MLCEFLRRDLCYWLAVVLVLLATYAPNAAADSIGDAEALVIPFNEGELMSVIAIAPKAGDEAAAAREAYTRSAFSIAADYGLKPLGVLNVADVLVGDFQPKAVAF